MIQKQIRSSWPLWVRAACLVGSTLVGFSQEPFEVAPAVENNLKNPANSGAVVVDIAVAPESSSGSAVGNNGLKMVDSSMGYSFSASNSDFNFGGEITPPLRDADGDTLTLEEARDYWRQEPARAGEEIQIANAIVIPVAVDGDERFYYSPHKEELIASQTGRIQITWISAAADENENYESLLQFYSIGLGTTLETRKMFWTEVDFEAPRIQIPSGRVQGVRIIYSDRLPETVAEEDRVIPSGADAALITDRTVWYDSTLEMIRAYNLEGNVLVEYLGDPRSDAGVGVREHLGFEVISVQKELRPSIAEVWLGEQLLPSAAPGAAPLSDLDFLPIQVSLPGPPVAQHFVDNRTVYYAVGENLEPASVEFYWLEEGIEGINWPRFRNNYRIVWPEGVSQFAAVYARPEVGAPQEVIDGSYLNLLATNTPELIFQDDPEGKEADLDFQFRLVVEPGEDGVNRSLIRFNSGNNFWYARLYSGTTTHLQEIDAAGVAFDPENALDFHITREVVVGQRLEPPHESLSLGGYLDPSSGNAYQESAYVNPFAEGGLEGASKGGIIPVNALDGNNTLRVWWFRELSPPAGQADLFQGLQVPTVIADYTIGFPTSAPQIVIASNQGTGDLDEEQIGGIIYFQNDPEVIGYNPNEEHAVKIAGRAYALRDDLNMATSSEPFVLLSYEDADGRPDMAVFEVLRENATYTFDYPAEAGKRLQAPLPLAVLPQPIDEDGVSRNLEVTPANQDPVLNGIAVNNLTHYDKFTFQDRKGDTWVYRGPHNPDDIVPGAEPQLQMQYYYKTLDGFAFPDSDGIDQAPVAGTIVPFLRPLDGAGNPEGDPVSGTALTITFTPTWPEQSPVLHFGETLAKPKFGLPQILGQNSVELVYQQSIAVASGFDLALTSNSVVLHDSTINRSVEFGDFNDIETMPGSVATNRSRGRLYFQGLPSHMQDRVYFNGLIGTQGALVYQGRFNDELAGEDYLLPNTFSDDEVLLMQDLCLTGDPLKGAWDNLILNMKVVPIFRTLDENLVEQALSYDEWVAENGVVVIGQAGGPSYGPTQLPHIISPDQAVNDYFLSAIGGGDGYVTIATGNGILNSPVGEPVQMHVFRVGEKLYRGELKPLVAANPLSENVTVQHTGDFAGDPGQFEFEWRKAPPENGLAPAVSTIENLELSGVLSGLELSRNESTTEGSLAWGSGVATSLPFPVPTKIYEPGEDRSVPGIRVTGQLDISSEITGGDRLNKLYLAMKLVEGDGAILMLNGNEALRYKAIDGEDSELTPGIPLALQDFLTNGGDFVVFEIPARDLSSVESNAIEILLNSTRIDEEPSRFELRIAMQRKADQSSTNYFLFTDPPVPGKKLHVVSGSGIETLGDNYYIMRYTPSDPAHPLFNVWSDWTNPALVEGWIKRVLAGINPFNQRVTDFFENAVNTNTSIVSQAGGRWEGDIALNLDAVQDAGLIEIYETVLKRGINLSIDGTPAVDYAPANDALLLAAGYLSDLYTALGNEAFADAANPTVSFDSQALGTLGDAAVTQGFEDTFRSTSTSRFAFQGQVPTLLDEELSLLRGRDDFLSPSIQTPPVYNRLFWNYTRGIDAGELIYALNYNIREQSDAVADGKVDAADAARMFPQAHGDAYGHYLMAVKNYYRLLTDPEFTWGTRIEAVNVLGQAVSIDYFDERKFASGAAALANTANQIVSLERRKAFQDGVDGWENLSDGRENGRTGTVRKWGVDDWVARSGQGAYFNWVVGNAILPDKDEVNEGIQKIDRTTVPELDAIAKAAEKIQLQLEAADARVNPLDLSENSVLFDISPSDLADGKTHFEQVYERSLTALKNASSVFERAADSTRLLRSIENQSQNLTQIVDDEEKAFIADLVDIFGRPYPGDVGPGKVYPQDYAGPDIIRYMAIDRPFEVFAREKLFAYDSGSKTYTLNVKDSGLIDSLNGRDVFTIVDVADEVEDDGDTVSYTLKENSGPYLIADAELGKRPGLGTVQTALNEVRLTEEQLYVALTLMNKDRDVLFYKLNILEKEMEERFALVRADNTFRDAKFIYKEVIVAIGAIKDAFTKVVRTKEQLVWLATESLPKVVGVATDVAAPARAAILAADIASAVPVTAAEIAVDQAEAVADLVFIIAEKALELERRSVEEQQYLRAQIATVKSLYAVSYSRTREVDALAVAYTRALERYRTEFTKGQTVLANREVFRRRASGAVQGYRTRDIAFRTFRTEALEEYQTLLDWASKYAFLAAQAYDYETGLLGSNDGRAFIGEIISSRALGILDEDGQPTLSASANGDPGLSGLLAKMKGDYDVVKGRLGFNNPETNGTTFSLRREYFRIPDGPEGDMAWQQKLETLVTKNLLTDADIAAHAMQLGGAEASAQPGFLINFPSTIEAGRNFFGKDLAPGDSDFSTTSFATKISSLGVVFEDYQGMTPCLVCADGGGDPTHNHDDALSATPDVFLIPTGLDTMRTPPLGDGDVLRTWLVQDYAMPLPFDLGSVEPTSNAVQQTSDSMLATFRSPRRHPSFRATDRAEFFFTDFADDYTSSRLVGRSAWNSNWKLAIPAKELLADEQEGIARFIRSVKDIKLHLKTYSYSGN